MEKLGSKVGQVVERAGTEQTPKLLSTLVV